MGIETFAAAHEFEWIRSKRRIREFSKQTLVRGFFK